MQKLYSQNGGFSNELSTSKFFVSPSQLSSSKTTLEPSSGFILIGRVLRGNKMCEQNMGWRRYSPDSKSVSTEAMRFWKFGSQSAQCAQYLAGCVQG